MEQYNIENQINELRSPEGWLYAGLPKFRALFARDAIISSIQLLDYDQSIAISTVRALINLQGNVIKPCNMEEPGKIIHEYQVDPALIRKRSRDIPWLKEGINYFSVDSTPLFIILLCKLAKRTNNFFVPVIKRSFFLALNWVIQYGIEDIFLSYRKPPASTGLQSQSWRDGIGSILDGMKSPVSVVGVQGYAFAALKLAYEAINNFKLDEEPEIKDRIALAINNLKDNFNDAFILENVRFYGLAVDGDGVLNKAITSDPGHLLFSGILNKEQQREVIDRLFESDMMTDYGIRTLSAKDSNFDEKAYQRGSIWPHDNWIIATGLKELGYNSKYRLLSDSILRAGEEMGGLPEYYGVTKTGELIIGNKMRIKACYPQAWSVGTQYSFSKS